MILSASRRTDLPAFYGEWTENRLREGRVLVPNPFRPSQVRDLRFSPETVDCIVFWTKNAGPMLPRLPRIREMGYSFYFQYTLTPYGPELEPGLANKRQVLADMRRLGEMLGPEGLVWRYDPILTGFGWTAERHLEAFGRLCRALGGAAGRCVVSFLDIYRGMERAFSPVPPEEAERLARGLGQIAAEYRLPLFACSEEGDFSRFGIGRSACIDPTLVSAAAGRTVSVPRDRNQRPGCGCAASVDIGMYGSCRHGCRYCYASGGRRLKSARHNPASPLLLEPGGHEREDR